MGSLIMHIAITEKFRKKYNLSYKFLVGALLPDIYDKMDMSRNETHYIDNQGPELPNFTKFVETNKSKLLAKDEIMLGYFCHIISDKVWYNLFLTKYIKDLRVGQTTVTYLEDESEHPIEEFWKIIYEDYDQIDRWICEKYKINIEELRLNIINYIDRVDVKNKLLEILYERDFDPKRKNCFITNKDVKQYIDVALNEVELILAKYLV